MDDPHDVTMDPSLRRSGSSGALYCSSSTLPVTPDSVVGADIAAASPSPSTSASTSTSPSTLSPSPPSSPPSPSADDMATSAPSSPAPAAAMAASPMSSSSAAAAAAASSSSAASSPSHAPTTARGDCDRGDDERYALSSQRLLGMLAAEGGPHYRVRPDYLHSTALVPPSSDRKSCDQGVSERCRRRTCEWMYDICDYFRLNREVVGVALFYVDRYFTIAFGGSPSGGGDSADAAADVGGGGGGGGGAGFARSSPVTRRRFQLVALTGLYVAIKLHGESREAHPNCRGRSCGGSPFPAASGGDGNHHNHDGDGGVHRQQRAPSWSRDKFSLAVCASISNNQFAPSEVEECERDLLATLDWHVNPVVSSGSIIDSLLAFLPPSSSSSAPYRPTDDDDDADRVGGPPPPFPREDGPSLYVYDCAKYLAELSASVPALCLVYRPSVVSYASVLCAIDSLHQRSSPPSAARSAVDGHVVVNGDGGGAHPPSSHCRRREFEARVRRASAMHFDIERANVEGATRILRAICPNLGDLFHLPTTTTVEPMSPTSTIKLS